MIRIDNWTYTISLKVNNSRNFFNYFIISNYATILLLENGIDGFVLANMDEANLNLYGSFKFKIAALVGKLNSTLVNNETILDSIISDSNHQNDHDQTVYSESLSNIVEPSLDHDSSVDKTSESQTEQ